MKEVILYRGPLERARLKLLINSILLNNNDEVDFVWIFPNTLSPDKQQHFKSFIDEFNLSNIHLINEPLIKYFSTIKKIKTLFRTIEITKAHFIGFSAWVYSQSLNSTFKVWYVNGVPEENLMYGSSITGNISNYFQWKINGLFDQPDKIVTVSKPMTRLIKSYIFKSASFIEIPITVDTDLFSNSKGITEKKYLTYLGTGAPWQSLDILKEIWEELHQIDSSLKFRVISRDDRTKILAEKLPAESIEFVGSNNFKEVANWLSESKIGFLIRRDNIVNEVAFPTKFAEYTAAGSLVALSELKWDLTSYLKNYNVGVLIPVKVNAEIAAQNIYEYLQQYEDTLYLDRLKEVSYTLSNEYWAPVLNKQLLINKY
ncbi:hypothetical protein [uncultured Pontibacter sp.]|uniref:hypothetical protein n=1 Tax=uncultured Pontibacter sp. TaxID=453356 RepID=UPI00262B3DE2|nr:hypothetical protein [uncultured Pontibacter sp.]